MYLSLSIKHPFYFLVERGAFRESERMSQVCLACGVRYERLEMMELHELLGCRESPSSLNAGRLARVHEESTSSTPVFAAAAVQPSDAGKMRLARNEEVADLSAGSRTLAAEVSKIKLPAWYPLAHSRMQNDARHRRLCSRQPTEPAGNGVGEGHVADCAVLKCGCDVHDARGPEA